METPTVGPNHLTWDWKGIDVVSVPVLIIGAGAAGARTAIELEQDGVTPLVVSKRDHGDAHTTWARGGVNAALGTHDEEDSWQIHAADTLDEGHYINDAEAVEAVCRNMPERIQELREWGMEFATTDEGRVDQRYFGAQSYRRTCYAGDHTGESLLKTLVTKAQQLGVPYQDNVFITKLLKSDSRVSGAFGIDLETGEMRLFISEHVVLAAGGATSMYNRHSSRDDENTADGVGLALDAGAAVKDMEFIQFHPTGMVGQRYGDEWDGRLVTEAVRGEGGKLFNDEGERFMTDYSPDQMELDARDVVARAIEREIDSGRGTENGGVYLDISHRSRAYIRDKLPRMYERFENLGVDIAEEPMEVAPTAHYAMGGVNFDPLSGETDVPGLYVVGETTAGVHGANRLGGNSLAETVAIGQLVGETISSRQPEARGDFTTELDQFAYREMKRIQRLQGQNGSISVDDVRDRLGNTMETYAGIRRNERDLKKALDSLQTIESDLDIVSLPCSITEPELEEYLNLEFMILAARAVVKGALYRAESRGAHFRTDYPKKHNEWKQNILFNQTNGDLEDRKVDSPKPSDGVKKALKEGHELDYHHLE